LQFAPTKELGSLSDLEFCRSFSLEISNVMGMLYAPPPRNRVTMNEFDTLNALVSSIREPDQDARTRAMERQMELTKPPGSLGRLEEISIWLAGVYGSEKPVINGKAVIVCAGDHGVTVEGISAFPASVTPAMVMNFLRGGAAISAICRAVGARVYVLDAGVNADLPEHPDLIAGKVRRGTGNIAVEPAMTRLEAAQTILAGAQVARAAIQNGANLIAAGDMGIGNTTPSAAITAFVTGHAAQTVTGRGTGVQDDALEKKMRVVERILERAENAKLEVRDGLGILEHLGGLEIAAMVGVMLQGAVSRVPVVVDGFIAGAAALIAVTLSPNVRAFLTASHRSQEPGHNAQLEWLKIEPLFDLGLRLGEGTGAALAMPMIESAARTLTEMATFSEASVPEGA
jgi:nicotinate-nucleotide--dimethylbenzimidazole phosphoribosyltransferase